MGESVMAQSLGAIFWGDSLVRSGVVLRPT
jgi:hypothetical protein